MHTFGQIIFLQGQLFSCFYQNNGFSITIRDWFPLSILITLCLYTSVHRCILWTRDLALVQQRELTLASDIPQCKSNWNHFSFICIWFPKITMVFSIFHMVDSWFFRLFIHKNTYVNRVLGLQLGRLSQTFNESIITEDCNIFSEVGHRQAGMSTGKKGWDLWLLEKI